MRADQVSALKICIAVIKEKGFPKNTQKCLQKRTKPVSCAERKRFAKNCGLLAKDQVGYNKQKISPNLTKRTDFWCVMHKFWSE